MKYLLQILIFHSVLTNSICQDGFITSTTYDQVRTLGYSVIDFKGSFYSIGVCIDDWNRVYQGLYLGKNDSQGNNKNITSYFEVDARFNANFSNTIIADGDNFYTICQQGNSSRIYIYRSVSDKFELFKSIVHENPDKFIAVNTDCVLTEDIHYSISTLIEINNSRGNNLYFSKITNDTIISFEYGEPNINETSSKLFLTQDSTFLFVGHKSISFPELRLHLLEVDRNGNVVSEYWDDEGVYRGKVNDAYLDEDDNLIISSEEINQSTHETRPWVYKIDRQGNLIWESLVGNQIWNDYASRFNRILKSQNDENYLLAGDSWYWWVEQDSIINLAEFVKISPNGEEIWHKSYSLIEGNVTRHYINDMEPTSDGGYIAIGELWCGSVDSLGFSLDPGTPPHFPCLQSLLIKIDEDGNIIPDTTNSKIDLGVFGNTVKVYPNPSSDLLFIEQEDIRNISYQLINSAGEIVNDFQGPIPHHTYIIQTHQMPSGIYFLRMQDDQGQIKTRQIIIN